MISPLQISISPEIMTGIFKKGMEWLRGFEPPRDSRARFLLLYGDLEVGILCYEEGRWRFSYSSDFRDQKNVAAITDFPDKEKKYESEELWPFFALRIPSFSQPAVQDWMARVGDSPVDEVMLLREFGRSTIANPFLLAPA